MDVSIHIVNSWWLALSHCCMRIFVVSVGLSVDRMNQIQLEQTVAESKMSWKNCSYCAPSNLESWTLLLLFLEYSADEKRNSVQMCIVYSSFGFVMFSCCFFIILDYLFIHFLYYSSCVMFSYCHLYVLPFLTINDLLTAPKEEGYVFTFVPSFICLFVCQWDHSKNCE